MIEILESTCWFFGENSVSHGGMIGQLTKCRYNRVIFYVRENLKGINSFIISSGERWGDKNGTSKPRRERWSLDLCAPTEHWDTLAALVHEQDYYKRPVLKAKRFSYHWAEQQFLN